jgi:methylmalonyl-CoA epimerase
MIKDVHHVGIAVRSLEAAYAFYRDALGLALVKEGVASARGVRAALLAVGHSYLEILEPFEEESPFARYIAERGEGLHHLALWSDDVEAQVAALRESGVPLEDQRPRDGFTGRLSYLAAEAFAGALLEVVEPPPDLSGHAPGEGPVRRVDHVVLHLPDVRSACQRFETWFGVPPKRTMERGPRRFAFLRPGDVIIELIGPPAPGQVGTGRLAGLAFEVRGIDALAESLRERGYPVGEPHAALQGGRIVSVHASGACGVPVALIDFG